MSRENCETARRLLQTPPGEVTELVDGDGFENRIRVFFKQSAESPEVMSLQRNAECLTGIDLVGRFHFSPSML